MKRLVLILSVIFAMSLCGFSFDLLKNESPVGETFIGFYSSDSLEIIASRYDNIIEIEAYKILPEDLSQVKTIADITPDRGPFFNIKKELLTSEFLALPFEEEDGIIFLNVISEVESRKYMLFKKSIVPVLVYNIDNFMISVWNRNGEMIEDIDIYNLTTGELVQRIEDRMVSELNFLPSTENTYLIHTVNGDYLWKPEEFKKTIPSKELALIVTDRPAYKAGETVNFRAFLRKVTPEGFEVLLKEVNLIIYDPMNREIKNETIKTDWTGSIKSSIETNKEMTRGSYKIQLEWDENEYTHYFNISDYKKPNFEVKVDVGNRVFIVGEPISVNVQADYYYGDPVRKGDISYVIYKNGRYIDNGTTKISNDEKTVVGYGKELSPGKYTMIFTVSDETGMELQRSIDFEVIQGMYILNSSYKKVEDGVIIEVKSLDSMKSPVSLNFDFELWFIEKNTSYTDDGIKTVSLKFVIRNESYKSNSEGKYEIFISNEDNPLKKNLNYRLIAKDEYGNVIVEEKALSRSFFIEESVKDKLVVNDIKKLGNGNVEIELMSGIETDVWLVADFSGKLISKQFSMDKNRKKIVIQKPEKYSFGSFHLTMHYSLNGNVETIKRTVNLEKAPSPYKVDIHIPDRVIPGENVDFSLEVTDEEGNPAVTALTVAVLSESLRRMFEGEEDKWKSSIESLFDRGFVTYQTSVLTDKLPSMFPSITNIIDYTEDYYMIAEAKVPEGSSVQSKPNLRKDFSDTALWSTNLFTDQNGKANISFKMPDSLDLWSVRTLASGFSGFGYSKGEMETWLPLSINMYNQEYFISGDSAQLVFSVMNSTEEDISAKCELFIDNVLVEQRDLILENRTSSTLTFEYPIKNIPPGSGEKEVSIKLIIDSNKYSDAIELSLPVKERYISINKEKTILSRGERSIDLDSNEFGTITITTDINEILFKSINYLLRYPYGCVEQTMSTWLPVIAAGNLDNILTADIKNKLSEYNAEALERLYGYQHYDGGWGWWKNDKTQTFMTAYVMFGFYLADKAGVELNKDVIEDGAYALGRMMSDDRDPFVQYVYTLYDDSSNLIIEKYDRDLASVALTSMALNRIGKKQEAINFLEKAWDYIKFGEESVEVNGESFDYFFDSDLSLLMLFKAINDLEYDDELALRVGQAILNRNNGGRWRRTISTCLAVIELSDFSNSSIEEIEVFIKDNSKLIKREFIDGSSKVELEISPEIEGPITIETTGNAFVIINNVIKYPLDSVEPIENGMKITRILRKEVEILSRNAYVSKTVPQVNSPYIIGQLEEVNLEENKEISINTKTEYDGMELHFVNDELCLGNYRLGWITKNTELLGKIGKSEFLLRKKLYNDRLIFIKLILTKNSPLKVGDLIIAESELELNKNIKYFIFEEPVPSGALYIDEYKLPDSRDYSEGKYSSSYQPTYSHIEPRYEKVSYFWYYSSNRTIRTSYRLIAPGEYMIPPSKVWGMYDEGTFGTSKPTILAIEDRE
ncbi:MAG: MG2 domain-containing protein [Kosmotogaceae bacterium]